MAAQRITPAPPRRSSGRVFWILLTAFFGVAAGVSFYMHMTAPSRAESAAQSYARNVSDNLLQPMLASSDLARPVSGTRYTRLNGEVSSRILSDGRTVRVTIWRRDATVTYSTQHSLVGKRFADRRDDVGAAIGGTTTSAVSQDGSQRSASLTGLSGSTYDTLLPLAAKPGARATAAVEIVQDYSAIQPSLNKLWLPLAIAFAIGFLVCVFVTPAIFSRTRLPGGKSQAAPWKSSVPSAAARPASAPAPAPRAQATPTPAQTTPAVPASKSAGGSDAADRRLRQAEKRAELAEERARQTAAMALQDKEKLRRLEQQMRELEQAHGAKPTVHTPAAAAAAAEATSVTAVDAHEIQMLTDQLANSQERLREAEQQVIDGQTKLLQSETAAKSLAEQLTQLQTSGGGGGVPAEAVARIEELEQRLRRAESQATQSDESAHQAEGALRHAEERARAAEDKLARVDEATKQAQQTLAEYDAKLRAAEAEVRSLTEQMQAGAPAGEATAAAEAAAAQHAAAAERAAAEADAVKQQLAELQARLEQSQTAASQAQAGALQAEALVAEAEARAAQVERAGQQLAELQAQLEQSQAAATQAEARAVQVEEVARAIQERLVPAEAKLQEAEAESRQLRERLGSIESSSEARAEAIPLLEEQVRQAQADLQAVNARLQEADERSRASESESQTLRQQLLELETARAAQTESLPLLEEQLRQAQAELDNAQERARAAEQRAAELQMRAIAGTDAPAPAADAPAVKPDFGAVAEPVVTPPPFTVAELGGNGSAAPTKPRAETEAPGPAEMKAGLEAEPTADEPAADEPVAKEAPPAHLSRVMEQLREAADRRTEVEQRRHQLGVDNGVDEEDDATPFTEDERAQLLARLSKKRNKTEFQRRTQSKAKGE